jgi:MFS-type transporter involved in bile tolerance (Atg22 family)
LLLRARWWVPGGLAAALAVTMFPAVGIAFLTLVRIWPEHLGDPFDDFSGYTLAVAGVTALAALGAFAATRFSFLFALFVGAVLVGSQILAAVGDSPSGDDRATAALIAGALIVIVGVFLDAFGRRRDAFWFHALGWLSVAAGLVFFTFQPGANHERGWIPMLIVGVVMLIVSGPIRRATWAFYGVLGYYAPVVHYLTNGLNESRWTFATALLGVGLSIFVFGLVLHRFSPAFAQWFVRRPPPALP